MSKSLLVMMCVVTGLLVLACAKPAETNRNAAPANAPANANTATLAPSPQTNRNDNTGPVAQVGVAECDSFITSYENCVTTKVPEAARPQFRNLIATWRTDWKKLAENPQTRERLVTACKAQLESARTQMKAYNCTF